VAATDATVTGNAMTGPIDDALAARNLAPAGHYEDSGCLSAALVVAEAARHGIALTGPLPADTSARARAGNGYARAGFTIGYDAGQVTCPRGKTSVSWSPCAQHGSDAIAATFSPGDRGPCPARELCTSSKTKRRQLTVADSRKPASTTPSWPSPSTSCGCTPTGTGIRSTGSGPATSPASNSASPHKRISHQGRLKVYAADGEPAGPGVRVAGALPRLTEVRDGPDAGGTDGLPAGRGDPARALRPA
jgi:hypothetical protein